jgi:hypothetical protein
MRKKGRSIDSEVERKILERVELLRVMEGRVEEVERGDRDNRPPKIRQH